MAKRETRRINPVARIAFVLVAFLLFFEVLIISGALELPAQDVAKYAPWAFEAFTRLVGEHPDSEPSWVEVEEAEEPEPDLFSAVVSTNETSSTTNTVPESVLDDAPTNAPVDEAEEVLPVG